METFFKTLAWLVGLLLVPVVLGLLTWAAWGYAWWLGLIVGIPSALIVGGLLFYGIGIVALFGLFDRY
jgi:hypothetical protein